MVSTSLEVDAAARSETQDGLGRDSSGEAGASLTHNLVTTCVVHAASSMGQYERPQTVSCCSCSCPCAPSLLLVSAQVSSCLNVTEEVRTTALPSLRYVSTLLTLNERAVMLTSRGQNVCSSRQPCIPRRTPLPLPYSPPCWSAGWVLGGRSCIPSSEPEGEWRGRQAARW